MEIKDLLKEIDQVKQEHRLLTSIYMDFSQRLDKVLEQCWSYKDDEKEALKVKQETFKMLKISKELLADMETRSIKTKEFKQYTLGAIIVFSIIFCFFVYVFHSLEVEIYNLKSEQIQLEKIIHQSTKTNQELINLIPKVNFSKNKKK